MGVGQYRLTITVRADSVQDEPVVLAPHRCLDGLTGIDRTGEARRKSLYGIGITAEYPVGHYVSRLLAIEHTLGGASEHLRTLSNQIEDYDKILIG